MPLDAQSISVCSPGMVTARRSEVRGQQAPRFGSSEKAQEEHEREKNMMNLLFKAPMKTTSEFQRWVVMCS